jgi:hypothetical protein
MVPDIDGFLRYFHGVNERALRDFTGLGPGAETWRPLAGDGESAWSVGEIVSHMAGSRLFFSRAYATLEWRAEPWPDPTRRREEWPAARGVAGGAPGLGGRRPRAAGGDAGPVAGAPGADARRPAQAGLAGAPAHGRARGSSPGPGPGLRRALRLGHDPHLRTQCRRGGPGAPTVRYFEDFSAGDVVDLGAVEVAETGAPPSARRAWRSCAGCARCGPATCCGGATRTFSEPPPSQQRRRPPPPAPPAGHCADGVSW